MDMLTFEAVFDGVPQSVISATALSECTNVTDLLSVVTNNEIYASKGEARRAIQGNAVSINKTKVADPNAQPAFELLQNKFLLVSKGKKNHLIVVE